MDDTVKHTLSKPSLGPRTCLHRAFTHWYELCTSTTSEWGNRQQQRRNTLNTKLLTLTQINWPQ